MKRSRDKVDDSAATIDTTATSDDGDGQSDSSGGDISLFSRERLDNESAELLGSAFNAGRYHQNQAIDNLFDACEKGDYETAYRLFREDATRVTAKSIDNMTPIAVAIKYDKADIMLMFAEVFPGLLEGNSEIYGSLSAIEVAIHHNSCNCMHEIYYRKYNDPTILRALRANETNSEHASNLEKMHNYMSFQAETCLMYYYGARHVIGYTGDLYKSKHQQLTTILTILGLKMDISYIGTLANIKWPKLLAQLGMDAINAEQDPDVILSNKWVESTVDYFNDGIREAAAQAAIVAANPQNNNNASHDFLIACSKNNLEVAQRLFRLNYTLTFIKDKIGASPLTRAIRADNVDVFLMFVHVFPDVLRSDFKVHNNLSVLELAIMYDARNCIAETLNMRFYDARLINTLTQNTESKVSSYTNLLSGAYNLMRSHAMRVIDHEDGRSKHCSYTGEYRELKLRHLTSIMAIMTASSGVLHPQIIATVKWEELVYHLAKDIRVSEDNIEVNLNNSWIATMERYLNPKSEAGAVRE